MVFIELLKNQLNTQEKRWAALITLIISLIIVTPLCGFLFQCGCDWPWLGLNTQCNYYKPHAVHQCPWCASMITGIVSTGIAMIAGVWGSIVFMPLLTNQLLITKILIRTVFGITSFILVVIMTAGFAAVWQGYPL